MLKHGEIVALDSTENLLHAETDKQLALTLDQKLPENLRQQIIKEDGYNYLLKLADYSQVATMLQSLQNQNINVRNLQILENDLENVFLRLTSDHMKDEK